MAVPDLTATGGRPIRWRGRYTRRVHRLRPTVWHLPMPDAGDAAVGLLVVTGTVGWTILGRVMASSWVQELASNVAAVTVIGTAAGWVARRAWRAWQVAHDAFEARVAEQIRAEVSEPLAATRSDVAWVLRVVRHHLGENGDSPRMMDRVAAVEAAVTRPSDPKEGTP